MGTFKEHILQSQSNIKFLSSVSINSNNYWDWQVTICFYSALHLVNAHIVKKIEANYLSHRKVDYVINPNNDLSPAKLDESIYLAYIKLLQLSRRSRYLLGDKDQFDKKKEIQTACATYSKHLKRAVSHLEVIINFMKTNYGESFERVEIKCLDLAKIEFENFTIIK